MGSIIAAQRAAIDLDFDRAAAIDTIFFGGIFFAFTITMYTANVRRFQAIDELAKLWAVVLSFSKTAQRWLPGEQLEIFQEELRSLFEKLRFFLLIDVTGEESKQKLADVDGFFNKLSLTIEQFRTAGLSSPELATLLRWMEEMYLAFERLRAIKENRTPKSLRFFIDWTLVLGVMMHTPQFAGFGNYGIFVSVIVMSVLLAMIKIQKTLEYPIGKTEMDHIDLRLKEPARQRIPSTQGQPGKVDGKFSTPLHAQT